MFVARKQIGYAPYFEEIGHVVAAADPLLADPDLLRGGQDTHTALGFSDGPTHTEGKLTPAGPKAIEANARLAGDLIPYPGLRPPGIPPGLPAAAVAAGRPGRAARGGGGATGRQGGGPPPKARAPPAGRATAGHRRGELGRRGMTEPRPGGNAEILITLREGRQVGVGQQSEQST